MNRSNLVRSSLLSSLALSACATTSGNLPGPSGRAANVTAFESPAEGFNTKNFFLDTGKEVVVFDAQFTPGIAEKSLAAIEARTKSPITHVVVTHPNPDKFGGLSAFKKRGIKVVASEATARAMPGVHAYKKNFFVNVAKMFTEESFPKLETVDVTFKDSLKLELSGEILELRELGRPGVSSNQTVVLAKNTKALFVGDLVHHKAHAWLEGGIVDGKATPTLDSWKALLADIGRYYEGDVTVYGGRGEAGLVSEVIPAQIAYLTKADALVSDYVLGLGAKKSELSTDKAGEHFAALATRFEAAFPGVALPYMVQYGVYGLVYTK